MSSPTEDLILNVDDTDAARYAKTRILTRAGFRVIEAATGEEALARAAGDSPALVLLDTKLPDISGFDVCRHLKENKSTAYILILQTSASYVATPDKVRALDCGADNYLFEPIEPEELVANVRALLRLGRVERELRDMDRRKDEFLAILAHELRNPLGPIRNAVELLRMSDPSPSPVHEHARQIILRQTDHMVRLVDDLLDVSRISRGKIALRRAPLDLCAVVSGALETSMPNIEARQHQLELHLPDELWLDGDAVRLTQVIGNLLNNAAKFTLPGGRIIVSVLREGEDAIVRVQDSGIGIASEQTGRIFDLFSQAGHAPDRVQDGLGIGLSLVQTLVRLHRGSVTASSAGEGQGSTFEVRLPVDAAAAGAKAASAAAGLAAPQNQRILVVDDNVDSAHIIASLLQLAGHETHVASSGGEAVEAAQALRPDIIFLDIGLPDMRGEEAASRIRALPELAGTVLVALSGYGQDRDRATAIAAGFDLHLTKPVTLDILTATIASLAPRAST
ncbi:response regulator [Pseudoduganella sp. UC29_106]|uniref:response regulator n=1 Tax=Pseudoduganella sp. UC29_106 TaxID=3374553 RepID=UPI003757CD93